MENKPRVLVSLCLLGVSCRYDGRPNGCEGLDALMERAELIPVCPEQLGGLPTPRVPAERRGDGVFSRDGRDVTAAFQRGAAAAGRLADRFGVRYALLKARSPSCGSGEIYDGTFTGARVPGDGVTAEALKARGIAVFTEQTVHELIEKLERDRI